MRIASGDIDKFIYFVALDSADLTSRITGLNTFTVYRSRNGAAAAAMTTPTINEVDSTNMPGVYELLVDEDTDISGEDSEEMVLHITGDDGGGNSMAPVSRAIELYTPGAGGGGATAQDVWEYTTRTLTALDEDVTTLDLDATIQAANDARFDSLDTAVATVDGNVDSILVDTNELQTDWVDGGRLDLILDARASQASVDTLNDPTLAEIADAVWDEAQAGHVTADTFGAYLDTEVSSSGGGLDAAGVRDAVGLATANLDTQLGAIVADTNELQTDWVNGGRLDLILDARASQASVDALNDPTLAEIADAVWDEAQAGHVTADTFGSYLDAAVSGVSGLDAAGVRTAVGLATANLDTQLGSIVADTNELQTDWVNGGRLDLILDARASQASVDALNDPTLAEIADAVWDEAQAGHVTADTFGAYLDAEVSSSGGGLDAAGVRDAVGLATANLDAQLGAIVADTNELQTDWVNGGRLDLILDARASQTSVDTVDGNVDSILEDTGTTLPATLSTISGFIDTEVAAILVIADKLDTAVEVDGLGGWQFTELALENAPSGSGLDAAGVRDAVGLATANLDTQLGTIVADTNELQTDWVNGGRLDLILDARASQASVDALNDPTLAEIADVVWDEAQAGHVTADSFGSYLDAAVSGVSGGGGLDAAGVRDAIGLATANLDTQLGDIPTNAELDAADDAVLAAIATVDGNVDSILVDTNELQVDWANGGRLDLILDARASQISVDDLPTNAELTAALDGADDTVLSAIDDLPTNAELTSALGTSDDAVLAAIAGLNDLDAAGVRTAVGMAAADLDTQLSAIASDIDGVPAAVMAEEVETGVTVLQSMRGFASVMMAQWSAAGGVYTWRDINNTKDRVVATVTASSRSTPTLDLD